VVAVELMGVLASLGAHRIGDNKPKKKKKMKKKQIQ